MEDITELLRNWEYDPEKPHRIVAAEDGRSVLQVRLPLGVEQYELEGRPDGLRPFGFANYLDYVESRRAVYEGERGTDADFIIDADDFIQLRNEGIVYYYRYLILFQMSDYPRTVRDTGHNLRLCEYTEKYGAPDQRSEILQFKPYILRMNALAKAMIHLQEHVATLAHAILEKAIHEIAALPDIESPAFKFEQARSISYLKTTLEKVKQVENDPAEVLEVELQKALEEENYERAALLRDRLRDLNSL